MLPAVLVLLGAEVCCVDLGSCTPSLFGLSALSVLVLCGLGE